MRYVFTGLDTYGLRNKVCIMGPENILVSVVCAEDLHPMERNCGDANFSQTAKLAACHSPLIHPYSDKIPWNHQADFPAGFFSFFCHRTIS